MELDHYQRVIFSLFAVVWMDLKFISVWKHTDVLYLNLMCTLQAWKKWKSPGYTYPGVTQKNDMKAFAKKKEKLKRTNK